MLITVDALRADHVGVYGYDRPTTPNLDALARESVVVRDHIVQAPFTKASMAALFSGLFPSTHKTNTVSRSFVETMTGKVSGDLPVTDVLDPALWTLARGLSEAGYTTIGLTTNPFLLREFGFANGFQHYAFLTGETGFATAREVVREALAQLDRRNRQQPVFLWLHVMEPHAPYAPPPGFRASFPPRQPPRPAPAGLIPSWIAQDGSLDANFYESLYDAEIREADAALGEFVDALRRQELWKQLVLVVTADHGEEFFEHGAFEHNNTLYDEMVRVPLIIKAPGLNPGMREIQTQAVDLAPTLAHLGGAAAPSRLAGTNIWPSLRTGANADPMAFSERPGERYSLRTREWKLISNLEDDDQLFHLSVDPHERVNLAASEPARTAEMRRRMAAVLAAAYQAGESVRGNVAPIAPHIMQRLKALGYVQ